MDNKAILISIKPKWCALIASGKKTIEIRKTRPKIKAPFKVYVYCTKDKRNHFWTGKRYSYVDESSHNAFDKDGNGKVIGEFICSEITTFPDDCSAGWLVKNSHVSTIELKRYADSNDKLYAWHISDLVIYDEPKELRDFCFPPELYCEKERCGGCPKDQMMGLDGDYAFDCEWEKPITRAPQSWCYVKEKESCDAENMQDLWQEQGNVIF